MAKDFRFETPKREEADNTVDLKYYAYHRRIIHPTKTCFALKNSIQTLVEAGVITLNKSNENGKTPKSIRDNPIIQLSTMLDTVSQRKLGVDDSCNAKFSEECYM
uniref:Uncharacterized protein n=1 Tax=Asparagus officinalis TaxID=4686 RepID=Q2AA64_ASPOF|nr:hypothetical protein 18.t00014 [Asparagus officinalis]